MIFCALPQIASARPPFAENRGAFWRKSYRPPPPKPVATSEKTETPAESTGQARVRAVSQPDEPQPLPEGKEPAADKAADNPASPAKPGGESSGGPPGKSPSKDEKAGGGDSSGSDPSGSNQEKKDKKEDDKKEEKEKEEEKPNETLLFQPLHKFAEEDLGLKTSTQYIGQFYKNTRGGLSTSPPQYRGNFDFSITADTEKLGMWEGGKFYLYTQDTHGKSLTARQTGDYMFYSLLETFPKPDDVNQLGELWYEHQWQDGKLVARAGRLDGYLYFANQELTEGFLNSSFTLIPPTTLPAWPFQVLGFYTKYRFDSGVEVKYAIYDSWHVGPQYFLNPVGDRGVINFTELMIPTQLLGVGKEKYGSIRVGAWYDTQKLDTISVDDTQTVKGNYGFYVAAQQMLIPEKSTGPSDDKESKAESIRDQNLDESTARDKTRFAQGLAIFAQYGWAPADRNYLFQYYGAGLVYRGLFRGRDEDIIGLGFGTGLFGDQTYEVDGSTFESAVEFFYRIQLTPNIILQPDIQYIANSGGAGKDSFPVGLHFILTL